MNIDQKETLLPEDLVELGREVGKSLIKPYWNMLTPEERISEFGLESLIEYLPLEQRLAGIPLEQRLAGISLEKRMAGLSLQDAFSQFKLDDVEAYLQNMKYKNSGE